MNGEFWAPGKPSFRKPYFYKRGCATMDPTIPRYSWNTDVDKKQLTTPTPPTPKYKRASGVLGDQEHQEQRETRELLGPRKFTSARQLKAGSGSKPDFFSQIFMANPFPPKYFDKNNLQIWLPIST